jgi:formate dehydrogenase subunit beta
MTKSAILTVTNGKIREAVNGFLKSLFDKKIVGAMLVPLAHPAGTNVVQALVTDPSYLDKADVFAPVMPVNSARIAQAVTRLTPMDRKTAVVVRPCEMRALVELVKLKQIQLENLILIGIDCPGAYSVTNYPKFAKGKSSDDFVKAGFKWVEDTMLRAGCQICEYPYPLTADITIAMIGLDPGKAVLLQADTTQGEEILGILGVNIETDSEMTKKRKTAITKLAGEIKERPALEKKSAVWTSSPLSLPSVSSVRTAGLPARFVIAGSASSSRRPLKWNRINTYARRTRRALSACLPIPSFST